MHNASAVLSDWMAGVGNYRFWLRFGFLDVKLRYRRTFLGPFWMTISFGASAAALTLVYSTLFKVSAGSYFAYLITGLAVWGLIAGLINEGCSTFIRQAHLIQQHPLPMLVHALRLVVGNFLVFLHNLLIVVIAIALSGVPLGWPTLLAVPALIVILLNGVWVAMLLGMLCTRFRDLPPLIALLVNIAFLVTPVFWYRHMLAARARFVDFNPLYAFLEFVRAPLLGQWPSEAAVRVVVVATILGWLVTLFVAVRLQPRLAYWI